SLGAPHPPHGRSRAVRAWLAGVPLNRRSNRPRQDLRVARDRFGVCLGGGGVVVGEAVVVECDGGCHDALAVAGDAVAASAWDLGAEAVAAEFDDEPGDAFASSVGLVTAGGLSWVEPFGDVGVAEAADGVLASEGSSEQGEVVGVGGAEAGGGAPGVGSGPDQGRAGAR